MCLASDYDLEIGITDSMIAKLPVSIRLHHHVKSHQDDATAIHMLPWEAQMNVLADHLATDYLDNYADPSKTVSFIPGEPQYQWRNDKQTIHTKTQTSIEWTRAAPTHHAPKPLDRQYFPIDQLGRPKLGTRHIGKQRTNLYYQVCA
jgi:hypothetical protein